MFYPLLIIIAALVILVAGLVWVWILAVPKTERYRSYAALTDETSLRNKAWDAAVTRARNHQHP